MKNDILVRVGVAGVLMTAILFSPSSLGGSSAATPPDLGRIESSPVTTGLPETSKVIPFGPCAKALTGPGAIEPACFQKGTWDSAGGCGGNRDSCCDGIGAV